MLEGATAPSRTPRKRGVGSVRTSVVHNAVPGRVRFRHAGLVAREELARKVETSLYAAVGVVSARASTLTGSVLVTYALPATAQSLASLIEAVVRAPIDTFATQVLRGALIMATMLVTLIVILFAALPTWPYSASGRAQHHRF